MRTLGALCCTLLLTCGLFAQSRGSLTPYMTGGTGNAVFPAGTSANNPFITRITPNVVYPGGGGPRLVVPGTIPRVPRSSFSTTPYVYAYPVYVPSYDPSSVAPDQGQPQTTTQQLSPNVIVIYPQPAPAAVAPHETAHPVMQIYEPETAAPAAEASTVDHYLFAFKDHTIYSAVAYWVDGDTLHYFTNGNTHNQVSLSLLDRDLTERLNKESGAQLKLPPR